MGDISISKLFGLLKPHIDEAVASIGGGSGPFAPSPHDLSSGHHSGSLSDAQGPQFLKTDGSRLLTGNQAVADGATIDGVDISVFKSDYDIHLSADAHTQYLNNARHDLIARHTLGTVVPHDDHGLLSGLADDDHVQYAGAEIGGLTRRAYEAGRLNKSVLAGNGLTGGGLLTADRTLGVDTTWSPTWTGDHTFQGLTKTRHLQPELTDTYDLGSSVLLWRKGWLSELDTVLFAQNTQVLLGGWFCISKGEGVLPTNLASGSTAYDFGQTMTVGDFVEVRSSLQVEYIQIGSLVSGTTFNITRNLDGSGANDWPAGIAYRVNGQSGNGRIELDAFDTPRIRMLTQGTTYNAQAEILRIGDLNANWGYAAAAYGVAIGEYASNKPNLTIDPINGLRLRTFSNTVMQFDVSGNADITGKLRMPGTNSALAVGSTPPTSAAAGTGLWMDRTGLYGLLSGTQQIKLDATSGKLLAGGGTVEVDANGLRLLATNSYANSRALRFVDAGGNDVGRVWSEYVASPESKKLALYGGTSTVVSGSVVVNATGNLGSNIQLIAVSGGGMQPEIDIIASETDAFIRFTNVARLDMGTAHINESTAIGVRVYRNTAQSINNTTWTSIGFAGTVWENFYTNQWDAGAPTRLTCRQAGIYNITGHAGFVANATGYRRIVGIRLNGTTYLATSNLVVAGTGLLAPMTVTTQWNLNVGDYIELQVYQDSGGNLSTSYDASHYSHSNFMMTRIP